MARRIAHPSRETPREALLRRLEERMSPRRPVDRRIAALGAGERVQAKPWEFGEKPGGDLVWLEVGGSFTSCRQDGDIWV